MSETIQPIRGMNDVLPGDSAAWQHLERAARETFAEYGYREVRVPLLERTELFKRSDRRDDRRRREGDVHLRATWGYPALRQDYAFPSLAQWT